VKDALLSADRHLNAEQLHRLARRRSPGIGIATVYRSLKCLCGCGKAVEIRLGDGSAVYAPAPPHRSNAHLICSACGSVEEAALPEFEKLTAALAAKHDFSPSVLELRGLCKKCGKIGK
jgi:Fur family ferric uptake transcriptional regulator